MEDEAKAKSERRRDVHNAQQILELEEEIDETGANECRAT